MRQSEPRSDTSMDTSRLLRTRLTLIAGSDSDRGRACMHRNDILSTCYEPVWQILLDWKNLCVNKILFKVVYSQNNMLLTAKCQFLCSVISQGKAVTLYRWGGKWNHLSTTHILTTDCAKNYCNRTIVQVILENVVTCFFSGTLCIFCS